jgi:hypothetical protein
MSGAGAARNTLYRVRQFWQTLTHRLGPDELAEVGGALKPPLFELFCRMSPAEQYHAYAVRRTLIAQGRADPDLLTAALLHDVGKSKMPLAVWERVVIVLGFRWFKRWAMVWGRPTGTPSFWTRPFVVALHHPAWGADMVEAAGGSPLTVALIRHHQSKSPELELEWLPLLQTADNAN